MRQAAERTIWIAHCLARVKCHHKAGTLSFARYLRLVRYVLAEYRED
jgi:hypothetical protein